MKLKQRPPRFGLASRRLGKDNHSKKQTTKRRSFFAVISIVIVIAGVVNFLGQDFSGLSFVSLQGGLLPALPTESVDCPPLVQDLEQKESITEDAWNATQANSIWNAQVASNYSLLREVLVQRRNDMEARLSSNEMYGSWFQRLFYDTKLNTSRGILAARDHYHFHGWDALVRRLQLKILSVQAQVVSRQNKETTQLDGCPLPPPPPLRPVPFVFAISGHSSSAGHGNFDDQSYASVMEQALNPMFQSLGLGLETRNYGMSAKPSAPELALCLESIHGTDVDVFMWDSSMTDSSPWNLEFWVQRALSHRNHPILMVKHSGTSKFKRAGTVNRIWEQNGEHLPMIVLDDGVIEAVESAVPSTLVHASLPDLLRYLKCYESDDGGYLETNEPCNMFKFDQNECPDRYWMVSWHPGYRRLALYGTLLALVYADAVQAAVKGLEDMVNALPRLSRGTPMAWTVDSKTIKWLETQIQSKQLLDQTSLAMSRHQNPGISGLDWAKLYPGVRPEWLLQSPSLCRTARLPSQYRFTGVLTGSPVRYDSDKHLIPIDGLEHRKIAIESAATTFSDTAVRELTLGYDDFARASQRRCSRILYREFPDYFYATDREWRVAILPSAAETNVYGVAETNSSTLSDLPPSTSSPYHGVILVCPLKCQTHKNLCYGNEVTGDYFSNVEFEVNQMEAVARQNFINDECFMLEQKLVLNGKQQATSQQQQERSRFVFPPRADGTWELKVRIKPDDSLTSQDAARIFQMNSIIIV